MYKYVLKRVIQALNINLAVNPFKSLIINDIQNVNVISLLYVHTIVFFSKGAKK